MRACNARQRGRRIAERRQRTTKHASSIDTDRVLVNVGHVVNLVPEYNELRTRVVRSPIDALWEAIGSSVAGGRSVHGVVAQVLGAGGIVKLGMPCGMRDNTPAVIDPQCPRELAEERDHFCAKSLSLIIGQCVEFGDGLFQPVLYMHTPFPQPPQKPIVVIADNRQRMTSSAEPHHKSNDVEYSISAIHKIADEYDAWMCADSGWCNIRIEQRSVIKLFEQRDELVVAAVDIADDVASTDVEIIMNPRVRLDVRFSFHALVKITTNSCDA